MKVSTVKIDSLTPDPANVRLHSDRNLAAIAGSLKRFGQQTPIVVDKNGIIWKGTGTWLGARTLKWETIKIVRTELAGSDLTAYAIADNRTGELAEWDYQGLAEIVRSLQAEEFDLSVLGWTDDELEPLLAADWKPPDVGPMPGANGDGKSKDGEPDRSISFTHEGWQTVTQAIDRRRGNTAMEPGDAVALVCRDYLDRNPK